MNAQREFVIPGAAEADKEAAETRARIQREARELSSKAEIAVFNAHNHYARAMAEIHGPLFGGPLFDQEREGDK